MIGFICLLGLQIALLIAVAFAIRDVLHDFGFIRYGSPSTIYTSLDVNGVADHNAMKH